MSQKCPVFQKIAFTQYDFYEDINIVYTIGFLQTFAIPSISRQLKNSEKIVTHCKKRDEDTRTVLFHLLLHGPQEGAGKAAINYMNDMHRRYPIRNEDYLYVLGIYVILFADWCERGFAWRKLTELEKTAWLEGWKQIAKEMGIREVPESYSDFREYMSSYEQSQLHYCAENEELAKIYLDMAVRRYPIYKRAWARWAFLTFLDPKYLKAMNAPRPRAAIRIFILMLNCVRTTLICGKRKICYQWLGIRPKTKKYAVPVLP